jgi:hypothetical protein
VLSRLAVEVRVDGEDETQQKEREQEGDQEETDATGAQGASLRGALRVL